MVFSIPTKHKTRTSINLIFLLKCITCYKNVKFSVFFFKCTKVGENYCRKMMHGVMNDKGINVSKTKTDEILGEINPEGQRKRQNVVGCSLNPKFHNAKYFGRKIYCDWNEKLGMLGVAYVCARDGFFRKIVVTAKKTYFGFVKYFKVSYSLFRNSLRCNIRTSQLVFYNGTIFY